jgi:hypothetical protein
MMPEEPTVPETPAPKGPVEKELTEEIALAKIGKVRLEGALRCGWRAGPYSGAVRRNPADAPKEVQDWFLAGAEEDLAKQIPPKTE